MPKISFYKFLVSHRDTKLRGKPSAIIAGPFGENWVYEGQMAVMFKDSGESSDSWRYLPLLLGKSYSNKTDLYRALLQKYRVMKSDFMTRYQETFSRLFLGIQWPSLFYQGTKLPGVPIIYILGFLGLLTLGFCQKNLGKFFWIWLGMLIFLVFAIFLVGNVRARFRLVFEPFLFLSFFAFLDWVTGWIRHTFQKS